MNTPRTSYTSANQLAEELMRMGGCQPDLIGVETSNALELGILCEEITVPSVAVGMSLGDIIDGVLPDLPPEQLTVFAKEYRNALAALLKKDETGEITGIHTI